MRRQAPFHFGLFHFVILALGLGTVSGWTTFFISSRSSAATERELRGQVSSLHQIQMDLLLENDRMKAAAGDLEPLQSQVEALRQEADLLTQARDLARAELVTAATGTRDLINHLNQARRDTAATGSVTTRPITSEQLVTRTAQKALTRLGYGPLKADGAPGPSTRRAVEAFQRANTLPVTGELDALTLQRLTPRQQATP
jgi:Putative peptidoglycan binding domain